MYAENTLHDLEELEDAIKAVLTGIVSPIPVETFPDNARAYLDEQYDSALGAVLVHMARGRDEDMGEGGGTFAYLVPVTIMQPELRRGGSPGIYSTIKAVVDAFNGQYFAAADDRFLVTVDDWYYVAKHENIWEYRVMLAWSPVLAVTFR